MKISKTTQLTKEDVTSLVYDLAIVSIGYETRCRQLFEMDIKADSKIAFAFTNNNQSHARKVNDNFFKIKKKFTIIEASGNERDKIDEALESLTRLDKIELNILVDYSSMTRIWYASILSYFKNNVFKAKYVNLIFSYSLSQYTPPPNKKIHNRYVKPIDGYYQLSIPNKPTAVIIGLGYIEERAFGLSEYFDIKPYLFVADNSTNLEYFEEVMKNNRQVLNLVKDENIYYYPLANLTYTETLLTHVCEGLKDSYRIILAPCGPKPFTLLCLLTALRNNYIDVWRISAGEIDEPVDKLPTGELLIYQVSFMENLD